MKKPKLIGFSVVVVILCILSYKFFSFYKKKNDLDNFFISVENLESKDNFIEQDYYIDGAIQAYWYINYKYPSIEELRAFCQEKTLLNSNLDLGILYEKNRYTIYDFGYDNIDGKGKK